MHSSLNVCAMPGLAGTVGQTGGGAGQLEKFMMSDFQSWSSADIRATTPKRRARAYAQANQSSGDSRIAIPS